MPEALAPPSPGALRACMSRFATGVTVVSYATDSGPRGATMNSFTSVSAEPPLVLVSVARRARCHDQRERGPGRHGVSNAFYLYLRDPDGHRVEIYTSDYYTGDPDHETYRWNVRDDRRRDFWGNAVMETWYKEAAPVLDESAVQVGADGLG
jgi:catechol 2,3-dioxygenase